MMNRFYQAGTLLSIGQTLLLDAGHSHQLARVLRAKVGDHLEVFNEEGGFLAEITELSPKITRLMLQKKIASASTLALEIVLGFALPKGQKLDWILQKGTELGVTLFVPLISAHTERSHFNHDRARKIVIEATEQCGGYRPPDIASPLPLEEAIASLPRPGVIAWEREQQTTLQQVLNETKGNSLLSFTLLVGPEGGWRQSEIELAKEYGIVPVHLGERIWRTETAAIVLPALVSFALGGLADSPNNKTK